MPHRDTNLCTPVSKRSAARERKQPVTADSLQVVVTSEMLLRQGPFQLLEQIGTIGDQTPRIKTNEVVVIVVPHEDEGGHGAVSQRIPYVPAPEKFTEKAAAFPSNDDVRTYGFRWLAPLSSGGLLRHRCTEIGVTVLRVLQFRWFLC
ncbi:hypothetical protein AVEN_97371-1 [Araneus ventricosus]|uniref:Uncharacterized protein n=1 Tax=Araneus ventricosus TaxID=182803 RepID=A0A4Y2JC71_ARAVE|nr:hypothetical protein AVEN_97371-1 [Araneus ventricosus]